MTFSIFFIEYKLERKKLKSLIPFKELPDYRKILFASMLIGIAITLIGLVIKNEICLGIGIVEIFGTAIAAGILNSREKNLKPMLENHYKPYSNDRMKTITNLLSKYKIDTSDVNRIDLIIEEAKEKQKECDYFMLLKKPINALRVVIAPVLLFFAGKITLNMGVSEIFQATIISVILIISGYIIIFSLMDVLKDLIYREYNKYEELIFDLRQVKIFYSNGINKRG